MEISAPFHGLFYTYDDLKKIAEGKGETIRWIHAVLLQRMLEKELARIFKAHAVCVERKQVAYDSVWAIFKPKIWIYTKIDGDDTLL